jgi:hypothetical protein
MFWPRIFLQRIVRIRGSSSSLHGYSSIHLLRIRIEPRCQSLQPHDSATISSLTNDERRIGTTIYSQTEQMNITGAEERMIKNSDYNGREERESDKEVQNTHGMCFWNGNAFPQNHRIACEIHFALFRSSTRDHQKTFVFCDQEKKQR